MLKLDYSIYYSNLMMAPPRKCQLCLSFAVTAIFFFSLILLPPTSGGINVASSSNINNNNYEEELRKMVLGSRPPACVNKCMSCRPCEATLVIPPHLNRVKRVNHDHQQSLRRQDDSYYLLSWKCRCGNKLYQP